MKYQKLKNIILKNNRGNTPNYEDDENLKSYPIINQSCVQDGYIKFEKVKYNKDSYLNKKGHLKNGDILICSTGGGTAGRVGFWRHDFKNYIVDSHVTLVRLKNHYNSRFIYYYLNSTEGKDYIRKSIKGSTNQEELSNKELNNFIFKYLPLLENQIKIANFLDENCSKIDTEISLLEKKSKLLEEYKQSLIFETVTKGLDKNAKMKDSGVEWIGEIPEHWKIKRVLDYFNGLKQITKAGRTDVLSLTLNGVVEKDIDNLKGLNPQSYDTYQIFKKNDLVFKLIDLENYKTSRVGLVFKDGIMSSAYIRLEPKNNTNIDYTYYQFFDLYNRGIFNYLGGNGVRSNLTKKDLLKLPLIIPPLEEQKNISLFLKEELKKIDETVNLIYKKLDLLKEYKQSLIHEAVTGQLEI